MLKITSAWRSSSAAMRSTMTRCRRAIQDCPSRLQRSQLGETLTSRSTPPSGAPSPLTGTALATKGYPLWLLSKGLDAHEYSGETQRGASTAKRVDPVPKRATDAAQNRVSCSRRFSDVVEGLGLSARAVRGRRAEDGLRDESRRRSGGEYGPLAQATHRWAAEPGRRAGERRGLHSPGGLSRKAVRRCVEEPPRRNAADRGSRGGACLPASAGALSA